MKLDMVYSKNVAMCALIPDQDSSSIKLKMLGN